MKISLDKFECLHKLRRSLREFFYKSFEYYENKSEIDAMDENKFTFGPVVPKKTWADAQVRR